MRLLVALAVLAAPVAGYAGAFEELVEASAVGFTVHFLDDEHDGIGAGICTGMVETLKEKISFSTDKDQKAKMQALLVKAQACQKTNRQLVAEARKLASTCTPVAKGLERVKDAPEGSDAAKERVKLEVAAKKCIPSYTAWRKKADEQKQQIEALEQAGKESL